VTEASAAKAACYANKEASGSCRRYPDNYKNQTADNPEKAALQQGDKSARRPPELLTRSRAACINREVKAGGEVRTEAVPHIA